MRCAQPRAKFLFRLEIEGALKAAFGAGVKQPARLPCAPKMGDYGVVGGGERIKTVRSARPARRRSRPARHPRGTMLSFPSPCFLPVPGIPRRMHIKPDAPSAADSRCTGRRR